MTINSWAVIECILFMSSEPVALETLTKISGFDREEVLAALEDLRSVYREKGHSIDVVKVGKGWQICIRPEFSSYAEKLYPVKQKRLSHAALETLSIIAYRQPITRAEIEKIRGVKTDKVIQTLLERGLIAEVGRRKGPGRPLLYGTTAKFLLEFNLKDLSELPPPETFFKKNTDNT
ncbi:MAG TPA: SMC-Scp complex subunit ScpB [Peptococcaceae bacterium]|nr:MAG: Segregation and condensation protein B [Clostridia bacterium 41_269]HBT20490.1 SMC-Scp complex subunit ScpB [Peptococcaceae bacterium]